MTDKEQEKLEIAVDRYVDALDLSALIQIVTDDLWAHYWYSVSNQERQEFIDNMQVSDEDVE